MKKKLLPLVLSSMLAVTPAISLAESPLFNPEDKTTFTLHVDWTWAPNDTFAGGICQEYMEQETGITIDMNKTSDSEQLNLMIAAGVDSLPDLVACSNAVKVAALSDSDLCWPLQELIDKYIPEWEIPEVEKKINAYFSEDGQYYMLKNEFNTAEEIKASKNLGLNFGQFYLRNDLYKQLGSPAIKTKEDFFNLMDMVKEKFPDIQPLVFNPREYSAFGSLVGFDVGRPTDEEGHLVMAISDPTYREMLRVMNELYRKGCLLEENFSYTSDEQTFQNWYAGKVFMITHFAGNEDPKYTARIQAAVPGAESLSLPLLDNWKYTMPVSGWSSLFITKNCSDPEKAIKMLYWAKQPENQIALDYGVPGTDWEYDADGNIVLKQRFLDAVASGKKKEIYKPMAFQLSANDYISVYKGFYAEASEHVRAIYDDANSRVTISNAIDLAYPAAGTDLRFMYDDIQTLIEESVSKICTAQSNEEFDAMYDELVAEAEAIGLKEVNEYLTKTYIDVCAILGSE